MWYVVIKYIHVLSVLALVSMLVIENLLVKQHMPLSDIKKVARADTFYGISAGVVLVAGVCLWLLVGKPAEFYSSNPVFILKAGLFIIVGLLSIYPTVFFIRSTRSASSTILVPKAVIMMVRAEVAIILILPLFAVLMSQGYGL